MSPTSIDRRNGAPRGDRPGTAARPGIAGHPLAHWASLAVIAAITAACGSGGTKPEQATAAAAGPAPAVVADYQQALRLLDSGDEAGAEVRLQSLADGHPGYAGPLVNLALIRARHDDLDAAAALLERAVAVCDRCAVAWNELGVVQRRQGRFGDAERSYLAAIAADPAYGNAHFNLGVLYELYLLRPELALDQYARFRDLGAQGPDSGDVEKWMTDLKRRVGTIERSARAEEAS